MLKFSGRLLDNEVMNMKAKLILIQHVMRNSRNTAERDKLLPLIIFYRHWIIYAERIRKEIESEKNRRNLGESGEETGTDS